MRPNQNPQKNFLPLFEMCRFSTRVGDYPTVLWRNGCKQLQPAGKSKLDDQKKATAELPQNACGANNKQHLGATKEKNTRGTDCKHLR
jgi:hypothetical protein